ncbi:hypothetical protein UVI_02053860 [Ustilaginoidea virens]|uniref:Uncharacterized protein n=1 Tax=Ustilaginoidea virens TaxID=1159556 RepID=A0A1B5KYA4_USTVR|nr:hypothetical protein UVI_02053860 [Ustilaginoidea virens]
MVDAFRDGWGDEVSLVVETRDAELRASETLKKGNADKAVDWPAKRKWLIVLALAAMTFILALGSSVAAPGVNEAMKEFHTTSSVLGSMVIYVYNIGLEIGPLILAAMSILRSLFRAFVSLAGAPLYETLGLGWGKSILGFISLALMPVPFLFIRYGEAIRASSRFQPRL